MFPTKCSCLASSWNTPQGLSAPSLSDRTADCPRNMENPCSLWGRPWAGRLQAAVQGCQDSPVPLLALGHWWLEKEGQVGFFWSLACSCKSCSAPWWYSSRKSASARSSFLCSQSDRKWWQFRLSKKISLKQIYHWNILLKQNKTKMLLGKLV